MVATALSVALTPVGTSAPAAPPAAGAASPAAAKSAEAAVARRRVGDAPCRRRAAARARQAPWRASQPRGDGPKAMRGARPRPRPEFPDFHTVPRVPQSSERVPMTPTFTRGRGRGQGHRWRTCKESAGMPRALTSASASVKDLARPVSDACLRPSSSAATSTCCCAALTCSHHASACSIGSSRKRCVKTALHGSQRHTPPRLVLEPARSRVAPFQGNGSMSVCTAKRGEAWRGGPASPPRPW